MTCDVAADVVAAGTVRRERLAVVAMLTRLTEDFDLAEDCWQDAVERALTHWPRDGVPDNPGAWLTVVARNRALDALRRRQTEHGKLAELHAMTEHTEPASEKTPSPYDDDRLKLLFACCHPALPLAGRVALTLKTVTGLSIREVARAFLVSEETMGQRLLRAKKKIAQSGITLLVPPADQLNSRIDGVLAVIYLLFSEGYSATEGQPIRDSCAGEAIQLGLLMVELLPDHAEARALLALMLLQHSRRHARVAADGTLVPLYEQDRALWDSREIEAGLRALARVADGSPGPYLLQAAIAALHATAPRPEATDWGRIIRGYDALLALQDNPVVALNRLVAVSFRDGPEAALAELAPLAERLAGYPLLSAVQADMLRRAGLSEIAGIIRRIGTTRRSGGPSIKGAT
jgi:RNA polymerase sigma-70 factor (ECF subfamily)